MKRVLVRIVCCLLLVLPLSLAAQTEEFRVGDIRVEGLQRISAGTVFAELPVRIGDTLTQHDIRRATRELFKVGLFADVSIGREDDVLVLMLEERPAINEIVIEGNKIIETEMLVESLEDNGLSEGQIFQRATLENITQALKREYIAQGRYGADVTIDIEELPRNQVKVRIDIDEGKVARIKKINIIGNEIFADDDLVELFELNSSGLFSWITSDDRYSREKLSGDLDRLESYYMDRGYLAFEITSTQVSLSPDMSEVYLTANVSEGDIYKVDEVELAGDPIIPEALVRRMLMVREGDTFSQRRMTNTEEMLTQRLGNEGYTFASVEGMTERDDEDNTVKVTFLIDPGQRAYVRRINFRGNTKTMDEVLRREMRQMEGGAASNAQIEHSRVRLERLGFFKEVEVDTVEVPGTSDQVDVEFDVEESPSGTMQFNLGYAQYSGLMVSGQIQQENWFGTGKQVGAGFSHNRFQTRYNFNYNDPYFTPDGVSRGFEAYYERSRYSSVNISGFTTDVYGFNMRFGYPVSDIERIGFEAGFRDLTVNVSTRVAPQEIIRTPSYEEGTSYIDQSDYVDALERIQQGQDFPAGTYDFNAVSEDDIFGEPGFVDENGNRFRDVVFKANWVRSTLNRGILANRGAMQRLSLQASAPGGDLEYFKMDYNARYFQPLNRYLTLHFKGHLGYVDSYSSDTDVPFFEHFYAGGFGSVRGFEQNTLGPRSTPPEVPVTVGTVWDDFNGDGLQQSNEVGGQAYVRCEDPEMPGYNPQTTRCAEGKVMAEPQPRRTRRSRDAFGGNVVMEGTVEMLFPLPFIEDQRSFQATLFVDAGNAFHTDCGERQRNCYNVDLGRLSASGGIGLTWISAFGPLTFSVARPIQKNEFDRAKFFDFSVGGSF